MSAQNIIYQKVVKRFEGKKDQVLALKGVSFEIKKGEFICFHIEANSFLYKMVRTIVGTLLDIGYGKLTPSDLERILQAKNRKLAGKVVPAKGLFLMRVNY